MGRGPLAPAAGREIGFTWDCPRSLGYVELQISPVDIWASLRRPFDFSMSKPSISSSTIIRKWSTAKKNPQVVYVRIYGFSTKTKGKASIRPGHISVYCITRVIFIPQHNTPPYATGHNTLRMLQRHTN
jgi:hypothetical protein